MNFLLDSEYSEPLRLVPKGRGFRVFQSAQSEINLFSGIRVRRLPLSACTAAAASPGPTPAPSTSLTMSRQKIRPPALSCSRPRRVFLYSLHTHPGLCRPHQHRPVTRARAADEQQPVHNLVHSLQANLVHSLHRTQHLSLELTREMKEQKNKCHDIHQNHPSKPC